MGVTNQDRGLVIALVICCNRTVPKYWFPKSWEKYEWCSKKNTFFGEDAWGGVCVYKLEMIEFVYSWFGHWFLTFYREPEKLETMSVCISLYLCWSLLVSCEKTHSRTILHSNYWYTWSWV